MRRTLLELQNVKLSFSRRKARHGRLKNLLARKSLKHLDKSVEKIVLSDINFTIREGDFLSIIGRNGAGKTTLLRILSGIYDPDFGECKGKPKCVPLIELGGAFSPELTVSENVFFYGVLIGMSISEIRSKHREIVEWANLENELETPLRMLSTGMVSRLAFSIATSSEVDILLVDEALSVGDLHFSRKALERIKALNRSGTAVVLVTHDLEMVLNFSTRVILLKQGKIAKVGKPRTVVEHYRNSIK